MYNKSLPSILSDIGEQIDVIEPTLQIVTTWILWVQSVHSSLLLTTCLISYSITVQYICSIDG